MEALSLKAYAKVNLALDVVRRRDDGYHEVKMIMQNLDIFDELDFAIDNNSSEITIETNREDIPTDDKNLVYKAIKLMKDSYSINQGVRVKLIKNIPVEAGMAGGSTDCAAALKAMNILFDLGLEEKQLMELGVRLGADVPYCVLGKTALSEGIGEILTPIKGLEKCSVLVVKPPVNVSTKMVYTNLKVKELQSHPDVDGMIVALEDGDLNKVASKMENVLETVTVELYPEIEEIKQVMKEKGALNAIMSGSGPTVFGIFEEKHVADMAAEYIKEQGYSTEIFVTEPV